ncbi:MAG: nucleoside triphosphate pyrophosphohydrolase [Pyrobaculum arsenaticum]|uniref:nucleoside triphosphate pyrophosphohydrolase n=1 Tax=Pyrobaculum arsenaticum TaxID=121277 RepID=UPI000E8AEF2F|nr:nucleoside triphosphate pyrophosphohydrolase [Pyrobaculum arsenaticum]MDM7266493.1 nucleoside triphosphate pyrophosphohydrolase [Aquificaceae bacterium]QWK13765.1 MAG: nucleoside triphosphate pyrophosphohydrolase [Aquificota bacterium]HAV39737.1 nucleoside triphosphate pyrophosphohydrolase [Aquificaceae bacterium]
MQPFEELLKIMEELRAKCPWDKSQTHESLKKYLIEEAYELLDAIDSKDDKKLKEELGDLLLQVVFHSQIAKERGAFDIWDVIRELNKKLIERHPHVFGCESPEEVLKNWEERKLKERESVLDGVPKSLPALMRSQKLQDRASLVGFDFERPEQALEKLLEEIEELKGAMALKDRRELEHELGDILTAVVELGRLLGLDAELCLQKANDRFEKRFRYMEKRAKELGRNLKDMSLEEMDRLWMEAKEFDYKEEG